MLETGNPSYAMPTQRLPEHIDLDDPMQVRRFCENFGCSESSLREVVSRVGSSLRRIQVELSGSLSISR